MISDIGVCSITFTDNIPHFLFTSNSHCKYCEMYRNKQLKYNFSLKSDFKENS